MEFRGRRVTVMGLGHFGGGVAAARWLARQGARVTVTDRASASALADAMALLADTPITRYRLGEHSADDFQDTDLVVVNPAVRPDNPFLAMAQREGIPRVTEIELFLDACPAAVLGVTGSNGKSTSAAMAAAILRADRRRVWLGGNIGGSLLGQLGEIQSDHWVVLELSSFQLFYLTSEARLPRIALVTNFTPNHLDWHGTLDHYAAAKQRILLGQTAATAAVLNSLDAQLGRWAPLVRGRLLAPCDDSLIPALTVPGCHNRINARLAASAALAAGCSLDSVARALASFSGLPQRLERIAQVDGRDFYNDSSSTTPESTIAALEAIPGRVWLLAGGSDKGIDLSAMSRAIAERAAGVALFGTVRHRLLELVLAERPTARCCAPETMREALDWCWSQSGPSDSILLSPGCASHDQFQNFRHRGSTFAEMVAALDREGQSKGPG